MDKTKSSLKSAKSLKKEESLIEDLSFEAFSETVLDSGVKTYRTALFAMFGLLAMSLLVNIFLALKPMPKQDVRGTSPDGVIHTLTVLDKPNRKPSTLIDFTTKCLRESLSFNFKNYKRKDKENAYCFTETGRKAFIENRDASDWFQQLINEDMSVVTISDEVGVIAGEVDGVEGWIVEIPLLMKRQSLGMEPSSEKMFARIVLLASDSAQHASGVAIHDTTVSRM